MLMVISRFSVANGMSDAVREAFLNRPHLVEKTAGFIRMEVANPTNDPAEFWLMTWWRDKAAFDAWHGSHAYHDSHIGIPKGLKLDPTRTAITHFDVVAQ